MRESGTLRNMMSELQSSISEIQADESLSNALSNTLSASNAESLLAQCEQALGDVNTKPKLRIIHHLACSGGTLISKCISALPNVYLLSELHPTTTLHMGGGKPKFLPADVTTQARYANVPDVNDLAWKIFESNIQLALKHVSSFGGHLVIRDHTHSDFCVGADVAENSSIVRHLAPYFDILRVATIRNPIDAYLSLVSNNWEHFEPKGFEEYCMRVQSFLNEFKHNQVIKYEDIVKEPQKNIKKIASKLELPYSDSFIDTFSAFTVTGDSGRSGATISERSRREIPQPLMKEIKQSKSFQRIATKLKYK